MPVLTVPQVALQPKQLCGVTHCAVPEHWRKWRSVHGYGTVDNVTWYVDGERVDSDCA